MFKCHHCHTQINLLGDMDDPGQCPKCGDYLGAGEAHCSNCGLVTQGNYGRLFTFKNSQRVGIYTVHKVCASMFKKRLKMRGLKFWELI
ncbi:hypothetical protein U14_01954 [Candidatus Moduliflexus flocculans]|uniref:Uncharacterized protein n=1 Tax=Candidatus Moduliflexus flocculans TaxID=1499966 RepID=A0A0S6VYM4_9BACT|nr:hypothetical protein U14_01954 [Candidatus Moduliflexus flocculans]